MNFNGGNIFSNTPIPLSAKLKKVIFHQNADLLNALAPRIEYCEIDLPGDNDAIILAGN